MSYRAMAAIQSNAQIRDRVSACVAVEGVAIPPEGWVGENAWRLAVMPGWADAWEAALTANSDPAYQVGLDSSVITDAMILAGVRSIASEAS